MPGPSDSLQAPNRTAPSSYTPRRTNGPSDSLQAPVRQQPVQYIPVPVSVAPRSYGGYSGIPQSQSAPAQSLQSQGTRASDLSRQLTAGISQSWQNIGNGNGGLGGGSQNGIRAWELPDQTRNSNTFKFNNNGGGLSAGQRASVKQVLDRLGGMSGPTSPPRYDAPKLYNDRVPQDQVAEGYEPYVEQPNPYQGPAVQSGIQQNQTPFGVPFTQTAQPQMQNYPMIPLANIPGGIGIQPYGDSGTFGGKDMIAAIGSDYDSFTGNGLLGSGPQITSGPETMPDPTDSGDGYVTPAIGPPDVYNPSESPLLRRGVAAVDEGLRKFTAPLQAADNWLGEKFPAMFNRDKGIETPYSRSDSAPAPYDPPTPLSGDSLMKYRGLSNEDRGRVDVYLRQGKTFAEALRLIRAKPKTASPQTPVVPKNIYNPNGAVYPRYTQNWAGLPKGRI